MIKEVIRGDLTKVQGVDYIVNASNALGPMGSGIAGAIRRAGGVSIQDEAFLKCSQVDYQPGDIYVTKAGTLPYKQVLHLVTMKEPGGETSYDVVEKCLENLVAYCEVVGIKKIALPALGTGVGSLDKSKVANIFKEKLTESEIEFIVVDIDPLFIYNFEEK